MNPVVYSLAFTPYLVLSIAIFQASMIGRRYTAGQMFKGQLLSFITLPVYMRASLFGLVGVKGTFQVTAKSGTKTIPYIQLWPQIAIWAVNLSAITWGVNRFIYEQTPAIIINIIWITYHFILLSGIFYFNEEDIPRAYRRKLLKNVVFDYKIVGKSIIPAASSGSETPKTSFAVSIPEKLTVGMLVMCKLISPEKGSVIFDGKVTWQANVRHGKGYATGISLVTASREDEERLGALIRK
jgi:hypothetical protein